MIVKRFDAEPVTRTKQAFVEDVIEGETPHAVQVLHTILTPGRVCVENGFRVRLRSENESLLRQFLAEFNVVVDLAVEDDPDALIGIGHRLVSGGGEINDTQAPPAQSQVGVFAKKRTVIDIRMCDRGYGVFAAEWLNACRSGVSEDVAFVVGAAVTQRVRHLHEQTALNGFTCRREYSGYAAHKQRCRRR